MGRLHEVTIIKQSKSLAETFGEETEMVRKTWLVAISALVVGIMIGVFFCHLWQKANTPDVVPQPQKVEVITPKAITPMKPVVEVCKDYDYLVPEKGSFINSLWRIAEEEYGFGYLYPLLVKANGIKNPDLIFPGQKLVSPCLNVDSSLVAPILEKQAKQIIVSKQEKKVVKVIPPTTPVAVVVSIPVMPVVATSVLEPTPARVETKSVPVEIPAPTPIAKPAIVSVTVTPQVVSPPPPQPLIQTVVPRRQTVLVERGVSFAAPGSAWNSFGTTPVEPGNRIDYFHVDQGIVLGQLPGKIQFEPYLAFNATKDTKGYTWDNKVKGEGGVKLVKSFTRGIIEAGGAYAFENRRGGETKSGFIWFTDGWFGWDAPSRSGRNSFLSALPGSGQWVVGNISPFERGNVIGVVRLEQGVTLAKVKSISLIPDVWGQVGFDSQNKSWNNRYVYGGGMKIVVPWKTGVVDFIGGYECVKTHDNHDTSASASMCGPTVRINIWTGWRKKIGGK
jgi:hypothetical protein